MREWRRIKKSERVKEWKSGRSFLANHGRDRDWETSGMRPVAKSKYLIWTRASEIWKKHGTYFVCDGDMD